MELVDADFLVLDAVFEIFSVFVFENVVGTNAYFPAVGDGNRDFVAVVRKVGNVENYGVFTVKILEFAEIVFVFHRRLLVDEFVPHGVFKADFAVFVVGDEFVIAARIAVVRGIVMAAFDAVFEHFDVGRAFLARAGDYQILVGYVTESGVFDVVALTGVSGDTENNFFHLDLPPNFDFAFRRGTE